MRFLWGLVWLSTSVPSIATAVGREYPGGRLAWMISVEAKRALVKEAARAAREALCVGEFPSARGVRWLSMGSC